MNAIKQIEKAQPEIKGNIISVCAYCYPASSVFDQYPTLRNSGKKISHGCCKQHLQTMLAMLDVA